VKGVTSADGAAHHHCEWVVEEDGTDAALGLRGGFRFLAPERLIAECANILWKKVQRGEILLEEAHLTSRLLERSGTSFGSMRGVLEQATELAIVLAHPAYDCVYPVAARQAQAQFVTADQRLLRAISERAPADLARLCVSLSDLAGKGRH
jgi:predicted nucleic acid-binding protein